MLTAAINSDYFSPRDMLTLRISILVGGALIGLFMIGDFHLVPEELMDAYFANRAYVQLPIVFALFASSFHPRFLQFAQLAYFLTVLCLVYINYYFIHLSWELAGFSFPYEGTLLYTFFGFFVVGMTFRYALWVMLLSSTGFICLMLMNSVYGDRTVMNVAFVVGSLFIGAIGRLRLDELFTALSGKNEQLVTLSTTDGLTGLANHRALIAESEQMFALMRRSGQPLGVLMIDLDYFKQFNDRYGHLVGDGALRHQAGILNNIFKRETDILGRYGGEEFMVIAPGGDVSEFERKAEAILAQWRELAIPHEDSPGEKFLSCSIGICYGMAAEFNSVEDMIEAADQALYAAKEGGRGMYLVAPTKS